MAQKLSTWDRRFLMMGRTIARWSKDPRSKVGAVIADQRNRIVSLGYNGFARGVSDTLARLEDRDVKHRIIIHAEENALLFADRSSLQLCSIYTWPFAPCAHCASLIIQSGISRVIAMKPWRRAGGFRHDARLVKEMYEEAGVEYIIGDR